MKIQDLQDGDLIFTVGSSEIAAAIRAATGSYSHVAIFFNGEIYHATHEKGVVNQDLSDFLQDEDVYDVYRYPAIILRTFCRFLIRFPCSLAMRKI